MDFVLKSEHCKSNRDGMFLLAWAELALCAEAVFTKQSRFMSKAERLKFLLGIWLCCAMAKQWSCAVLQVKSILGPLWAPHSALRRGLGKGASASLAPLAVKWMFLDESKHTLSCVCGSQVAEELPLTGGPRGTGTEAPVKSHTYKRSRHTAREQLTHFLLTGLTVKLLSILLNPQITNIYKVFPSETLTVTVVLWQKCRKFVSKCIILLK